MAVRAKDCRGSLRSECTWRIPEAPCFMCWPRHLKTIEKEALDRGLWFWGLVENVVGDEKDVKEMTDELGWDPLLVEAGYISRARRPRLYWSSVGASQSS